MFIFFKIPVDECLCVGYCVCVYLVLMDCHCQYWFSTDCSDPSYITYYIQQYLLRQFVLCVWRLGMTNLSRFYFYTIKILHYYTVYMDVIKTIQVFTCYWLCWCFLMQSSVFPGSTIWPACSVCFFFLRCIINEDGDATSDSNTTLPAIMDHYTKSCNCAHLVDMQEVRRGKKVWFKVAIWNTIMLFLPTKQ